MCPTIQLQPVTIRPQHLPLTNLTVLGAQLVLQAPKVLKALPVMVPLALSVLQANLAKMALKEAQVLQVNPAPLVNPVQTARMELMEIQGKTVNPEIQVLQVTMEKTELKDTKDLKEHQAVQDMTANQVKLVAQASLVFQVATDTTVKMVAMAAQVNQELLELPALKVPQG